MTDCPCGNTRSYEECCQPYHSGSAIAPTAEAMMRSRYSAYVKGEIDYLIQTLLPEKRSLLDRKAAREWSESAEWLGLEVISAKGGEEDQRGQVEFIAKYSQEGVPQSHHELSTFKKRKGRWLFVEGKVLSGAPGTASIARSAPCPCGSGKKYKRCCGAGEKAVADA